MASKFYRNKHVQQFGYRCTAQLNLIAIIVAKVGLFVLLPGQLLLGAGSQGACCSSSHKSPWDHSKPWPVCLNYLLSNLVAAALLPAAPGTPFWFRIAHYYHIWPPKR